MVESVEGLCAELQLLLFCQQEALIETYIEVVRGCIANTGSTTYPRSKGSSLGKASLVEPLRFGSSKAASGVASLLRERSP
jgi:hypothetical protein